MWEFVVVWLCHNELKFPIEIIVDFFRLHVDSLLCLGEFCKYLSLVARVCVQNEILIKIDA